MLKIKSTVCRIQTNFSQISAAWKYSKKQTWSTWNKLPIFYFVQIRRMNFRHQKVAGTCRQCRDRHRFIRNTMITNQTHIWGSFLQGAVRKFAACLDILDYNFVHNPYISETCILC